MTRTVPQHSSRPTFRDSFHQLKQAQKARKGVPMYLLYVNRPAGRAVAAALRHSRFTPNHVTAAGAVLTYGALIWLAFGAGPAPASAAVGVLLALGYILDSADGQLARLQGTSSAFGEWLDHVLDNGRIAVMHIAAFCFLARTTSVDPLLLAAGCGLFLLASSTIFFGGALLDQLRRNARSRQPAPSGGGGPPAGTAGAAVGGAGNRQLLLRSVITLPVDYGVTCLAFLLLPWPRLFLAAYLLLACAHVLMCLAFLPKWRSELLALG